MTTTVLAQTIIERIELAKQAEKQQALKEFQSDLDQMDKLFDVIYDILGSSEFAYLTLNNWMHLRENSGKYTLVAELRHNELADYSVYLGRFQPERAIAGYAEMTTKAYFDYAEKLWEGEEETELQKKLWFEFWIRLIAFTQKSGFKSHKVVFERDEDSNEEFVSLQFEVN